MHYRDDGDPVDSKPLPHKKSAHDYNSAIKFFDPDSNFRLVG